MRATRLVMKFGGSLVGSQHGIKRVADLIVRSRKRGVELVAVVSALGDVTNLLLEAAAKAPKWSEEAINDAIKRLREMHFSAVKETTLSDSDKEALMQDTDSMLGRLKQTLLGVSVLGELSPRSRDMIVSFGERLCAPIVAAEVRNRGIAAPSLTGGEAGITTDSSFGEAVPLQPATNRAIRRAILSALVGGEVPIVAGFIARSRDGEITTLGRGGSDYTATLIGAALKADEVWIWTDVDGIMSADPRVVDGPAHVPYLSYAEAEELAFFGAKNMHPLALGPARLGHLPVRIKNGFSSEFPGTLITDEHKKAEGVIKVVALVRNVGLLTVAGETLQGRPGIAAEVFSALAKSKVNILMISQSVSEASIGMVVRRHSLHPAELAVRRALAREGIPVNLESDPAIAVVAAVGAGMRGEKGVAAKVFGAAAAKGINVKMIAQGSSELNISFVVEEKDAETAVRALHTLVSKPPKHGRRGQSAQ